MGLAEGQSEPAQARRLVHDATAAFADPLARIFDAPDHSLRERRELLIGHSAAGRLLLISFTERAEAVRLFSAREATADLSHHLAVARRFGWRGLAVFLGAVAVIGPPRDYLIAAKYPEWMVFAPGVAPILADAATYVGIVALGHAVMRLVAGPAREDRFARRPRDTA